MTSAVITRDEALANEQHIQSRGKAGYFNSFEYGKHFNRKNIKIIKKNVYPMTTYATHNVNTRNVKKRVQLCPKQPVPE